MKKLRINVVNKRTFKVEGEVIHRPAFKGKVKGSVLGNPFYLSNSNDDYARKEVILRYKEWLWKHIQNKSPEIMKELDRLYEIASSGNKLNLICFCAPKPCHGDVVKAYLQWRYKNEHYKVCKRKQKKR